MHYFQNRFFQLLLVLSFGQFAYAQGNSLLVGEIKNPIKDYLIVRIDKTYLNNRIVEEVLMLNEEGKFGLSCPLEIPQKIQLTYNQKTVDLFLAPNDTLILKIDGALFPQAIVFEGAAAADNQLLRDFERQFPKDNNQFRYRQYRKGVHYYKVHELEDQEMRTKAPIEYLKDLRKEKAEQEAFILSRGSVSKALKDYLEGELHYQFLYKQLAYGHIYQGRHGLDSSYFYFMDSLTYFNDQTLAHPQYRDFLMAWVNFQLENRTLPDSLKSDYAHQYYYAKEHLEGFSRYWLMANLLTTAMRKENPEFVLAAYRDFFTENPYREFDQLVMDAFQRTQQFAAGSPAPTFALKNLEGKTISLRDFQGKLVYIDFWASWCKPCMQKLQDFKAVEALFEGKNVVFLHVNLDQTAQKWKTTVEEHQFGGIHLYNDQNSSITRDYEVLAVPKFFLITKEGNFAYTPPSSDLEKIANAIKKLVD